MAAHEEMQRVAAAEQATAKQAAQHADELAALQAQLEEQRQLLHSTQVRVRVRVRVMVRVRVGVS